VTAIAMRKSTVHVWITMFFCALAVVAEALTSGSFPALF
jgi:hypothetical protein